MQEPATTWLEREIREQPSCLGALIESFLQRSLGTASEGLRLERVAPHAWSRSERTGSLGEIRLLGCGTAFHAAELGAMMFEHIAGVPARAEMATSFDPRRTLLGPQDRVVALSQSGESSDTLRALRAVRELGCTTLALTSNGDSSLARGAHASLDTKAGRERAIPSTKGFTGLVLALYLLALDERRSQSGDEPQPSELAAIAEFPARVSQTLEACSEIGIDPAPFLGAQSAFFLGDAFELAIAREGALKLAETALLPSSSYPSAEIRHGPLALVCGTTPVILSACQRDRLEQHAQLACELASLDAPLLVITTHEASEAWPRACTVYCIPPAPAPLDALLAVVPLQLLALRVGRARGCDVDRPRNLSKSVRVE